MIKRFSKILFLIFVLLFSLVACSQNSTKENVSSDTSSNDIDDLEASNFVIPQSELTSSSNNDATESDNGNNESSEYVDDGKMRYEDKVTSFLNYDSNWELMNAQGYSGGTAMQASNKDSVVSFTFQGIGFDIISYRSYTRGTFQVVIQAEDGSEIHTETVSCYDKVADKHFQNTVFHIQSLERGTYTVIIRLLEDKAVDLDAVDIYS